MYISNMFTRSTVSNSEPPNPAKSIQDERLQKSFNLKTMHEFLEGSPEESNLVLRLYQSLERDPILRGSYKDYDLTEMEERELVAVRIDRMSRYIENDTPEEFMRRLNLVTIYDPSLGIRISINLLLYLNCIKGNGTSEQYNYWCRTTETGIIKRLYGCFAMTELGHGSNVAGCETTATFDKETDEFVINTPHIGATKWWIGGAAHSATHSAVYARLIVDGKDYGVKTFVVPLRDSQHELLPGVSIGDIGSKMGRKGVDNGWIQYSNVKIPRFFMLQKFCKVTAEGKVTLPPLEQLAYISLIGGRVGMAVDSYRICARFTTIAIRYAIGRRQFRSDPKDRTILEKKLMDYPNHQRRLLPYLALAYAMAAGTKRLERVHSTVVNDLEEAVKINNMDAIKAAILETKSLFIDSGSLKSTCTWLAADCINECRQSCGGQGFSSYTGFGKAYGDWVVQCTWEGDNNVLGMSAGRTIIKHVSDVINQNKKVSGTLAFLSSSKEFISDENVLKSPKDLQDLSSVLKAIEVLIIRIANQSLEVLEGSGKQNWDSVSYQRVLISKLTCHHYLLETLIQKIDLIKDSAVTNALRDVAELYVNTFVLEYFAGDFLSFNVTSPAIIKHIKSTAIPGSLQKVREQAVHLTDAFQQPDAILNSMVGKYDGNIYENIYDTVNQASPPVPTKPPYSEFYQNHLNRAPLAERERHEKSAEVAKILSQ